MAEMSIAEFEDLAAAHGPDPALWPDGDRARARRLLAGPDGNAARAAASAARALDDALADLAAAGDIPPLNDALTARILADAAAVTAGRAPVRIAGRAAAPRRSWLADLAETFGGWRTAAISAAACALIGLGAGYATPDSAVAALGYSDGDLAEEQMVVDLGWDADSDLENFGLFGDAG